MLVFCQKPVAYFFLSVFAGLLENTVAFDRSLTLTKCSIALCRKARFNQLRQQTGFSYKIARYNDGDLQLPQVSTAVVNYSNTRLVVNPFLITTPSVLKYKHFKL